MIRDENYYAGSQQIKARSTLMCTTVVIPSQERRSSKLDLVDDVRMLIFDRGLDQDRIVPATYARSTRTCISSPSAPSSSAGDFCTYGTVHLTCVHSPDTVPVRVTYRTV
jgi:hypothetical protein